MDLISKFEKGEQSRTYQRIDSEYKVNIFVGYNNDGNMSLVITEYGKQVPVKSSKIINVSLKNRSDGKLQLAFDLLDNAFKSMFIIFCKDIIATSEKAGPEMAISNALTRWKYWKEMFGTINHDILSKSAIKGLIGELYELRDHLMQVRDERTAVSSWMGPLLGHKDFEIDETWYEVKSVNENAVQVNISSLEQLESDLDGHLVIVRLEDTSAVNEESITLNKMVLSVINQINDADVLELFQNKLNVFGYECIPEYDNYSFSFKGMQRYSVTKDFPRIRRCDVSNAIGNASYTILLTGISEFKEA